MRNATIGHVIGVYGTMDMTKHSYAYKINPHLIIYTYAHAWHPHTSMYVYNAPADVSKLYHREISAIEVLLMKAPDARSIQWWDEDNLVWRGLSEDAEAASHAEGATPKVTTDCRRKSNLWNFMRSFRS